MAAPIHWELAICIAVAASVLAAAGASMAATSPQEQQLWPGEAPGSEGVENTERAEGARIFDVTVPTLTYYPAQTGKATGTAVVVCPGGAFRRLATKHEGHDVAEWLNSLGITAAVLKYRVGKQIRSAKDIENLSVADGMRAIRTLRSKAEQLGIAPDSIGIMGFSAGGNLAARLMARMDEVDADSPDPIERESCRPDFAALVYASINTLNRNTITSKTPPVFMIHAANDRIPGDKNAKLFVDLYAAGIPVELHIFTGGGHGFGMGNRGGAVTAWPALFATWITELQQSVRIFKTDYLATLGGQSAAVLDAGAAIAYKNIQGEEKTAEVVEMQAADSGVVSTAWDADKQGRAVGYAFCYLGSDKDQEVQCYFGSGDEARVWINGELALANDTPRSIRARDDRFTVKLRKGLNPVMVKASQRTATWEFILEVLGEASSDQATAGEAQPVNALREDGRVNNWLGVSFHMGKRK